MYRRVKDQKFLHKIFTNSSMRKNKFFHRPLTINFKNTDYNIIKIKPHQVFDALAGYHSLPQNLCFFCANKRTIDTKNFIPKIDVVFTNSHHQIVALHQSISPHTKISGPTNTICNV
jgi:hypothetical protein